MKSLLLTSGYVAQRKIASDIVNNIDIIADQL